MPVRFRQNYHLVRYFPSSEKDRGDSYLFLQANDYDLYTGSKLDFSGDGVFSYTLGDIDWTEEGDAVFAQRPPLLRNRQIRAGEGGQMLSHLLLAKGGAGPL